MMKKIVLLNGLRVLIRPQMSKDVDGLWQLYSSLLTQTRILAGIPEQMYEQEFRERMAEVVKNKHRNRFVCIVQSPEEKFIGYFGIYIGEGDPQTGWIFLFVHDAYQGKGLGNEIMRYIVEEASSLSLERLRLQVYHQNEKAIRLFKRFNFKKEGESIDPKTKKLSYTMYRVTS